MRLVPYTIVRTLASRAWPAPKNGKIGAWAIMYGIGIPPFRIPQFPTRPLRAELDFRQAQRFEWSLPRILSTAPVKRRPRKSHEREVALPGTGPNVVVGSARPAPGPRSAART